MNTKLYQVFVRIDGALSTALCVLASLFVVAMMLHIVAGIFSRHVLGEPLGAGPTWLAHRVHRHVYDLPGRNPGHPRRRSGPDLPPPRE